MQPRIDRAKELLKTAQNAAMATVNSDGSPHNTPYFFIHDDRMDYVYWASNPQSLHCQNALRTGQVFIVMYESNAGGGLYIKANDSTELSGSELTVALDIQNNLRAKAGLKPLPLELYQGDSLQRMYRATPTELSVNIKDTRQVISKTDLMN